MDDPIITTRKLPPLVLVHAPVHRLRGYVEPLELMPECAVRESSDPSFATRRRPAICCRLASWSIARPATTIARGLTGQSSRIVLREILT